MRLAAARCRKRRGRGRPRSQSGRRTGRRLRGSRVADPWHVSDQRSL